MEKFNISLIENKTLTIVIAEKFVGERGTKLLAEKIGFWRWLEPI